MRVIQPGREQNGWAKEFVCTGTGNGGGGCGAKLLVEEPDLYRTYNTSWCESPEPKMAATFRCCACKVQTDISYVPSGVKVRPKE